MGFDLAELDRLTERLRAERRLLVAGPAGSGKTSLAARLADRLAADGRICAVASADPGQPPFGAPAAVNLATRRDGTWQLERTEGIGSLDAARFRLPLLLAVQRLLDGLGERALLLDAPGVHRGMGAAELLAGLVRSAGTRTAVWLDRADAPCRVADDLRGAGASVERLAAPAEARAGHHADRVAARTRAWERTLGDAEVVGLPRDALAVCGAPPPTDAPARWAGRHATLLDREGRTLALGEIVELAPDAVRLRLPPISRRATGIAHSSSSTRSEPPSTACGRRSPSERPPRRRRGRACADRSGADDPDEAYSTRGVARLHDGRIMRGRRRSADSAEAPRSAATAPGEAPRHTPARSLPSRLRSKPPSGTGFAAVRRV